MVRAKVECRLLSTTQSTVGFRFFCHHVNVVYLLVLWRFFFFATVTYFYKKNSKCTIAHPLFLDSFSTYQSQFQYQHRELPLLCKCQSMRDSRNGL